MNNLITYTSTIISVITSANSSSDKLVESSSDKLVESSSDKLVESSHDTLIESSPDTLVDISLNNISSDILIDNSDIISLVEPIDNSTYTCGFFDTCTNIFSNEFINSINNCWLFKDKYYSKFELEKILDNNDHEIIFDSDDTLNNIFLKIPIDFYSTSEYFGNGIFLCKKFSSNGEIILILLYKYENEVRILIDGALYKNMKKYNIIEFNAVSKLQIGDIVYQDIAICKITK